MRRKISIARLIFCMAIALALLIGMQAGSVAGGMSCVDCAGGGNDASSTKGPCPNSESSCIISGYCAFGCATETPLHAAAAPMSPRISESICSRIASVLPSQALKPDPYPPRSHV